MLCLHRRKFNEVRNLSLHSCVYQYNILCNTQCSIYINIQPPLSIVEHILLEQPFSATEIDRTGEIESY